MNSYQPLAQKKNTHCYSKFIFLPFFLLISLSLNSQCIIEQLEINGNNGPNLGASLGQQILACETGLIEEIEFFLVPGTQVSTMKIEIYESATDYQNLIWTVDGIPIDGSDFYTIDMTPGFGDSQELMDGVTYTVRFWNTGTGFFFFGNKFGAEDAYPDGFTLNHFGDIINWAPNFNDRYFRIAINGAALPVELIDFKVREEQKKSILSWQTASEENNAGFNIEHSVDGKEWDVIGYVEGNGTTSETQRYEFTHHSPYQGDNYYRLQQVDYDGQFEYSPICHLTINKLEEGFIQAYPNPSSGKFTISIHNQKEQKANIKLLDSTGKLIYQKSFLGPDMGTFWKKEFDLPQREVYFVISQIGDKVETQKVTVIDDE